MATTLLTGGTVQRMDGDPRTDEALVAARRPRAGERLGGRYARRRRRRRAGDRPRRRDGDPRARRHPPAPDALRRAHRGAGRPLRRDVARRHRRAAARTGGRDAARRVDHGHAGGRAALLHPPLVARPRRGGAARARRARPRLARAPDLDPGVGAGDAERDRVQQRGPAEARHHRGHARAASGTSGSTRTPRASRPASCAARSTPTTPTSPSGTRSSRTCRCSRSSRRRPGR